MNIQFNFPASQNLIQFSFSGKKKEFLDGFSLANPNKKTEKVDDTFACQQIEKLEKKIAKINKQIEKTSDIYQKNQLLETKNNLINKQNIFITELYEKHQGFIGLIAQQFKHYCSLKDAFAAASYGFLRAAKKVSPSKHPDTSFLTYAKFWMIQQIERDINANKQIRIPMDALILRNQIKNAQRELKGELLREPEIEEIAAKLDISVRKVKANLLTTSMKNISLDAHIEENDKRTFENIVSKPNYIELEDKMNVEDLDFVNNIIKTRFSEKEQDVIDAFKRKEPHMPLARKYGVSCERIRQLQNLTIKKLREICLNEYTNSERRDNSTKDIQTGNSFKRQNAILYYTPELHSPKLFNTRIHTNNFINNNKNFTRPTIQEKLITILCKNEINSNKAKIIEELNKIDSNKIEDIIDNVTSTKRADVLKLLLFDDMSKEKIASKLGSSQSSISVRLNSGINDLKEFLLQKENFNYTLLKKSLIKNLPDEYQTEEVLERIKSTSNEDIDIIAANILTKKELAFLNERFSLGKDTISGCHVKSIKELANIFDVQERTAQTYIILAAQKLREYFMQPSKNNSNLALFIEKLTSKIEDDNIKIQLSNHLQGQSLESITKLFNKILTPNEKTVLMTRYNLAELNAPKKPLITKQEIIKLIPDTNSESSIALLEQSAFSKIKNYFIRGYNSNNQIFMGKIINSVSNQKLKEILSNKFSSYKDIQFDKMLKNILTTDELHIITDLYNLNEKDKVVYTPVSRNSLVAKYNTSYATIAKLEASAIKKIIDYHTVGLPSNIDVFATEMASYAISEEDKQKLLNIIKSKTIGMIKKDLSKFLDHSEMSIIQKYYKLDKFIPVMKELATARLCTRNTDKNITYFNKCKLQAITKILDFYLNGMPSNIRNFADAIAKKAPTVEEQKALKKLIVNIPLKRLHKIMKEVLTPRQNEILFDRYQLKSVVECALEPISYEAVAFAMQCSYGTVYNIDNKALQALYEYFTNS